jgi:hypothetical protein
MMHTALLSRCTIWARRAKKVRPAPWTSSGAWTSPSICTNRSPLTFGQQRGRGRRSSIVPGHLCLRQLSEEDDEIPLLIAACGGNADKSQYSKYATALARRGYSIAVMNKVLMMAPPPPAPPQALMRLNAITPVDFNRVIHFVQSTSEALGTNASSVVLVGQSYGGAIALSAAHGFCSSFFCGMGPPSTNISDPTFPVELSSSVIGASVYGASIYKVGFLGEPRDDRLTNVNERTGETIPFFFFWGNMSEPWMKSVTVHLYLRAPGRISNRPKPMQ